MIECKVESIRVSLVTQHRVVILKELNSERYLPIWIGAFEADAIALELQEVTVQRPFTHDLLRSIVNELGATVTHILINELHDDTFYARIVIDANGRHVEVDSRPSDAIALAVRARCPIFVEERILDGVGVVLDSDDDAEVESRVEGGVPESETLGRSEQVDNERLSVFRDFINSIDLDDLGKPGEGQSKS